MKPMALSIARAAARSGPSVSAAEWRLAGSEVRWRVGHLDLLGPGSGGAAGGDTLHGDGDGAPRPALLQGDQAPVSTGLVRPRPGRITTATAVGERA